MHISYNKYNSSWIYNSRRINKISICSGETELDMDLMDIMNLMNLVERLNLETC